MLEAKASEKALTDFTIGPFSKSNTTQKIDNRGTGGRFLVGKEEFILLLELQQQLPRLYRLIHPKNIKKPLKT